MSDIDWVLDKAPLSIIEPLVVSDVGPNVSRTGSSSKTCTFYSRPGGCRSGSACPFQHVPFSTSHFTDKKDGQQQQQVCVFFARGRCKVGASCKFLHGELPDVAFGRHKNTKDGGECGVLTEHEFIAANGNNPVDAVEGEETVERVVEKEKIEVEKEASTFASGKKREISLVAAASSVLDKYSMRKLAKKVKGGE